MLPIIDSLVTEVLEIYVYGTQGILMSAYDCHLCIYFLLFSRSPLQVLHRYWDFCRRTVISTRTLITLLKKFTALTFQKSHKKVIFYQLHCFHSLILIKKQYGFVTVNQVRISAISEKNTGLTTKYPNKWTLDFNFFVHNLSLHVYMVDAIKTVNILSWKLLKSHFRNTSYYIVTLTNSY